MASGDTLLNISLSALDDGNSNPRSAPLEVLQFKDYYGGLLKRMAIRFDNKDSTSGGLGLGPTNPEFIYDFIMPAGYANTTGVTLALFGAVYPPKTGTDGNVVFGFSLEYLLSDTANNNYEGSASTGLTAADPGGYWGTEATGTITFSTTAGRPKSGTVALVKANFGGGTAASGATLALCRLRLRRLTTNASDTLKAPCYVFGLRLNET